MWQSVATMSKPTNAAAARAVRWLKYLAVGIVWLMGTAVFWAMAILWGIQP